MHVYRTTAAKGADLDPDATIRIGAQLRAHREARSLGPDVLAERLGISRAALYRAEKGEIARIEVLGRIAAELGMGLDELLGQGPQYHDNAASLFARLAELEDGARRITGVFSPISYLMTTPAYDRILEQALHEVARPDAAQIAGVMAALRLRRRQFAAQGMGLRAIVALNDLERFLRTGLSGHGRLPETVRRARLDHARAEVEALAARARLSGEGRADLRLVESAGPTTSFAIITRAEGDWLMVSPFPLGDRPNLSTGVGIISRNPGAIETHRTVAERLWQTGLSGEAAARRIEALLS